MSSWAISKISLGGSPIKSCYAVRQTPSYVTAAMGDPDWMNGFPDKFLQPTMRKKWTAWDHSATDGNYPHSIWRDPNHALRCWEQLGLHGEKRDLSQPELNPCVQSPCFAWSYVLHFKILSCHSCLSHRGFGGTTSNPFMQNLNPSLPGPDSWFPRISRLEDPQNLTRSTPEFHIWFPRTSQPEVPQNLTLGPSPSCSPVASPWLGDLSGSLNG